MKSMFKFTSALLFSLIVFGGYAQQNETDSVLRSMHAIRKAMLSTAEDTERQKLNEDFKLAIEAFLNLRGSFKEATDSLSYFGDLYSPDKAFRLLTWNLPLEGGRFSYFCYVQKKDETWYELVDTKHDGRRLENKSFSHDEWMGALYYEILPVKYKKERYYFLMGWDGRSEMSNRKVLETMYFDSKGFPKFGKPVLKTDRFTQRRYIMEYTEEAYATLRYHPEKKMIVFSHLMPLRPELEGVYEFYAPDLSYDGFKQKGKVWELVEDVDVRSEKSGKPYKDPRKDTDVPVKPEKP